MLKISKIKLYLENTPGKSITGLARHMGVAINTARTRMDTGDCMLSELQKIHEYTGLPYSDLVDINLPAGSNMVTDPQAKYEISDTQKQLIESLQAQIALLKEKQTNAEKKR